MFTKGVVGFNEFFGSEEREEVEAGKEKVDFKEGFELLKGDSLLLGLQKRCFAGRMRGGLG